MGGPHHGDSSKESQMHMEFKKQTLHYLRIQKNACMVISEIHNHEIM